MNATFYTTNTLRTTPNPEKLETIVLGTIVMKCLNEEFFTRFSICRDLRLMFPDLEIDSKEVKAILDLPGTLDLIDHLEYASYTARTNNTVATVYTPWNCSDDDAESWLQKEIDKLKAAGPPPVTTSSHTSAQVSTCCSTLPVNALSNYLTRTTEFRLRIPNTYLRKLKFHPKGVVVVTPHVVPTTKRFALKVEFSSLQVKDLKNKSSQYYVDDRDQSVKISVRSLGKNHSNIYEVEVYSTHLLIF